ncbi:unnamed protein product [Arctogadus glacialis]
MYKKKAFLWPTGELCYCQNAFRYIWGFSHMENTCVVKFCNSEISIPSSKSLNKTLSISRRGLKTNITARVERLVFQVLPTLNRHICVHVSVSVCACVCRCYCLCVNVCVFVLVLITVPVVFTV